jgi:hypothetical protein
MKSLKVCFLCGRASGVPHRSEADCFRAVDAEIKATMAHLRSLTMRKSQLLRDRVRRQQLAVAARRRPRL